MEMEVTFHFFICNMTVKRGQRGFHEGWNLTVVTAQPDIEFASHTQLIQTSAGCSCQSGRLSPMEWKPSRPRGKDSFRKLNMNVLIVGMLQITLVNPQSVNT